MKANLLHRCYDITGEAITWLPDRKTLLWVDIDRGILHQYDLENGVVEAHSFPEMITAIIPWKGHNEEVILAMKNRMVAYHLTKCDYRVLVELTDLQPWLRTNDCKASPDGRILYGVMRTHHQNNVGGLYCISHDLSCNKVLENQIIPNGIVWNKAGDRMFYADSGRHCIEEYGYSPQDGVIGKRSVIEVSSEYGVPDGMTIDAEDNLWVAHWGGYGVYVWNPSTGKLMDKVEVPVPNVASCTFGGIGSNKLFITTALDGLSDEQLREYPLSGSVFVADTPDVVPGENHYPFMNE